MGFWKGGGELVDDMVLVCWFIGFVCGVEVLRGVRCGVCEARYMFSPRGGVRRQWLGIREGSRRRTGNVCSGSMLSTDVD